MAREGYQVDVILLVYCLNDISQCVSKWGTTIRRVRYEQNQVNELIKNSYLINFCYFRLYASLHPELANYFSFLRDAYAGAPWKEQSDADCVRLGARPRRDE